MSESLSIRTTIRGQVPRIPFADIAETILGKNYELSLVICGDSLARRMYIEHRKQADPEGKSKAASYASNVLSFPLSKTEGEIFLNIRKAEREARLLGTTPAKRAALLFVHGCFHLKGLDHGRTMERSEEKVLRRFHLL